MASILKATNTVGSKVLRSFSGDGKHVRGKLKCLSKDHPERSEEEAPQRIDKGKEKMEEPQKERKLSYGSSSVSGKFGTTIAPAAKQVAPPPLKSMEASTKAVKVEMIRKVNEEAKKEEK